MIKKVIVVSFFILSNQIFSYGFNEKTLTNITLKNEFGIAYPNAKIIFSSLDTNFILTVDNNGKSTFNLKQGIEFTVSCFIGKEKYDFEDKIYIEKNKNISEVNIDLQFDLYESIFEINNLNFDSGKYEIQKKYFNVLENLILLLNEQNKINIEIAGHTDSIGDNKANQILSEKRAISVKKFLVENSINSNRIFCVGYGEKQPVESNKTKNGREKNRRIEIRILK
tara:strand:+ start:1277 stop:1951 length:675 start_codon:yes stop_codon:yes gene_type:complete